MNYRLEIRVPVDELGSGAPSGDRAVERGLRKALVDEQSKMREIILAILYGGDPSTIDGDVQIQVRRNGVPRLSIKSNRTIPNLTERTKRQLLQAISLTAFPPGPVRGHYVDPREDHTRKIAERFLDLEEYSGVARVVVQGGHRVPGYEYTFCSNVARAVTDTKRQVMWVTGCGDGIMEAPFVGAENARKSFSRRTDIPKIPNVGITEVGILAKERPNKYVDILLTYPDIEQRMEAFIRLANLILVFPGGVGTAEEIMQLLGIMLANKEENASHVVKMHLLERNGGEWMPQMEGLLHTFFSQEVLSEHLSTFSNTGPDAYKSAFIEEPGVRCGFGWNGALKIPAKMQEPIGIHDPNEFFKWLEDLRLDSGQHDAFSMAVQLRLLFSAIVELTVKQPAIAEEWKSQGSVPQLHGDANMVKAFLDFVDILYKQGRLAQGCARREDILRAE